VLLSAELELLSPIKAIGTLDRLEELRDLFRCRLVMLPIFRERVIGSMKTKATFQEAATRLFALLVFVRVAKIENRNHLSALLFHAFFAPSSL
jgi:hypothetical protein